MQRSLRNLFLIIGLVLVVVLVVRMGFAPSTESLPAETVVDVAMPEPAVRATPALMGRAAVAPEAKTLPVQEQAEPQTPDRMLVYTARMELRVEDPQKAVERIWQLAEDLGGFVVSSSLESFTLPDGLPARRGVVRFRVPADALPEALARLRAMALEVLVDSLNARDVTEEYVDLQARLRNLQATEAQLQEILEQARTTADVLAVYRELTFVRQEIERIQGRMKYLEQVTAFALVEVTLLPPEAQPPVLPGTWSPEAVARAALRALVRTLQLLASGLIWLALYVLPLGVFLGLPGLWVYRRWKRARGASPKAGA